MKKIFEQMKKEYSNVADVEYFPARSKTLHGANLYELIQLTDKKTGLVFIMDSQGNAKIDIVGGYANSNIWQNYLHDSSKDVIGKLDEWMRRTAAARKHMEE
jgi:hypothetical protein